MKTPHQLKEAEKKRERKEATIYQQRLESQLEKSINGTSLTSERGTFRLSSYSAADFPQIEHYCHKHGWDVQYAPRTDGGYSMMTESEYEYTVHRFELTPRTEKSKSSHPI